MTDVAALVAAHLRRVRCNSELDAGAAGRFACTDDAGHASPHWQIANLLDVDAGWPEPVLVCIEWGDDGFCWIAEHA